MSLRQERLQKALRDFEDRMDGHLNDGGSG
jgi:hypothetical protein